MNELMSYAAEVVLGRLNHQGLAHASTTNAQKTLHRHFLEFGRGGHDLRRHGGWLLSTASCRAVPEKLVVTPAGTVFAAAASTTPQTDPFPSRLPENLRSRVWGRSWIVPGRGDERYHAYELARLNRNPAHAAELAKQLGLIG